MIFFPRFHSYLQYQRDHAYTGFRDLLVPWSRIVTDCYREIGPLRPRTYYICIIKIHFQWGNNWLLLILWALAFYTGILLELVGIICPLVQDKRVVRAFRWLTIGHSLSDPQRRFRFYNIHSIFPPSALRSAESCCWIKQWKKGRWSKSIHSEPRMLKT